MPLCAVAAAATRLVHRVSLLHMPSPAVYDGSHSHELKTRDIAVAYVSLHRWTSPVSFRGRLDALTDDVTAVDATAADV
jgi:hypothetical protein